MAAVLVLIAAGLGAVIYALARKGTPLHRGFAAAAAGVDGELVDVISNMGVVRAFGATVRERHRLNGNLDIEMGARRRSLIYLEKLRLIHAVMTALLTAGVVGWGILLWQDGKASVGDIVLMTTLAFTILHSTRDLAVALVDLTQHLARLEEAVGALLIPHELADQPDAPVLRLGTGRGRVRPCALRLPRARRRVARLRPDDPAGSARRPGRVFGCRQVHRAGAAAALL